MEKLSDKELQEFWVGFCGFKWWDTAEAWCFGDDEVSRELPELDLNNLFKYAVPKLDIMSVILYLATKDRWGCYFGGKYQDYNMAKTPALALYQAIQKARVKG